MVSGSTVSSDASLLSDVFSNYSSGTDVLNGNDVWQGKSKENAITQMTNFVDEFSSPISSQMSEFASACEKYAEWEEKKEDLKEVEEKLSKLDSEKDSAQITGLNSQKNALENEISVLDREIRASLNNVRSQKLNVTTSDLSTSGDYSLGEFINYYQGDYHQSYGYGKTIAEAGCGPTSMAMVLTYLTGESHDPVEMAEWSMENGHRIKNKGTAWTYFPAVSSAYGIECEQQSVTKTNIVNSLNEGKTIILNVGPGHFTNGGHYIVLKGLTSDGKVEVADPASKSNSTKTWDVSTLTSEGKGMWAFDSDQTLGMTI